MVWLVLAFIVVPLAEIAVIITVGSAIGVWPTIAILLTVSVLGAVLVKHEGIGVWTRINQKLDAGEIPGRELVDGGIILAAGTMLLLPGFITDAAGLLLLFPPTRALVRTLLAKRYAVQTETVQSARVTSEWTIVDRPRRIGPPTTDD